MVAILSPGESIRNSFYYNENKVKEGVATLIHAQNYPSDLEGLNENTRLAMLQKLAGLRPSAAVNSMHITLNFDPSETLSNEKLIEIAGAYMYQIGFGNQPYLVYQHSDAGHPHIHLVTTNIEATGQRIDLHHLGIRKSEPARKAIEIEYGLVKAEDQNKYDHQLKPAYTAKVIYGRSESRRSISNILNAVLPTYKFSSIWELNALLKLYNVVADTGTESSRVFKNKGLLYHVLDEQGKPIGVPIKASSFYNKPTLKYLQDRFISNSKEKVQYKTRLKNAIDLALRKPHVSGLQQLISILEKEGIHTVLRENKDRVVYGITYIDHRTKCVFNGSDLDKGYSAKSILERCEHNLEKQGKSLAYTPQTALANSEKETLLYKLPQSVNPASSTSDGASVSLLEELMQYEHASGYVPYELSGKKKKRRKKIKSQNT